MIDPTPCGRPFVIAHEGAIETHCFAKRKDDFLGRVMCKDNTIARLRLELAAAKEPSDSILHRVNATREPNLRPLTLDGGWEPGDTQSVVIAMLRDLDEQHAAEQADRAGLPRPSVTAQPQRATCMHDASFG